MSELCADSLYHEKEVRMKQIKQRSIAGELIFFSLPLILSGVLQQLYSWADAFIVGHAEGELQLAAIGATGSISSLLINIILGLTLGLSVMAAQSYGRKDIAKIRKILTGYLPVLASIFFVLSLAVILLAEPVLHLMNTPDEIFDFSGEYLRIVLIGVPFLACY
ncbi:MAG: oligosaccharide flippase family protein, partial [Clostridia bacterium]|nr:oligosaccharide flippase family protein [Clostridia bacterium]